MPDPPVTRADWLTSARYAASTWAAAAAAYLAVNVLYWMIGDTSGPSVGRLLQVWNRWDTGHYLRIAEIGYTAEHPDSAAFFPLYPLLIRVSDPVLPGGPLTAALVVSNLACLAALTVLHRLATHELGEPTAARVLFYLMAFPAAFFLCAGYTSSLFLLLSAGALYAMRRERWWLAGAVGALATATRLAGVLLIIAFVIEYGRQHGWSVRRWRPDALAIAVVPSGLVAFALYCWWRLDDPLAFSHAQTLWGRHLSGPWQGLSKAIGAVVTRPLLQPMALHNAIDAITLIGIGTLLVLCVVGPYRLRRDQLYLVAYAGAGLVLLLIGPVGGLFPMQGAPRYALELLPAFFVLARMGANQHLERIYLLPAVAVQVMFLLTFFNGVWIS
ncbi:MAG: mannosyltransferase family protein [Micromonosporaceae bacterium]